MDKIHNVVFKHEMFAAIYVLTIERKAHQILKRFCINLYKFQENKNKNIY